MKYGLWRNLICASALSLNAAGACALGLGEARLLSHLGAPLLIEIEAINDEQLPLDALRPRIATSAAYAAEGLDKPVALLGARITTLVRGNRTYLRVENTDAVSDLWLPLLVEIGAGNGMTRKHFDFLVDQSPASLQRPGVTVTALPSASAQNESQSAQVGRRARPDTSKLSVLAAADPSRPGKPVSRLPAGLELKLDYGEALLDMQKAAKAKLLHSQTSASEPNERGASMRRPMVRLASIRTSGLLDDAGILDDNTASKGPTVPADQAVTPMRRQAAMPTRRDEATRNKRYQALDTVLGEAEARVGQFEELLQSLAGEVSALEQRKASLEQAVSAAQQSQAMPAAPARHSASSSTDARGNFLATVFSTLVLGVAGGLGFSSRHRVRSALRTRIDEWKEQRAIRNLAAQEVHRVPAPVPKTAPKRHSELDFTQV